MLLVLTVAKRRQSSEVLLTFFSSLDVDDVVLLGVLFTIIVVDQSSHSFCWLLLEEVELLMRLGLVLRVGSLLVGVAGSAVLHGGGLLQDGRVLAM